MIKVIVQNEKYKNGRKSWYEGIQKDFYLALGRGVRLRGGASCSGGGYASVRVGGNERNGLYLGGGRGL